MQRQVYFVVAGGIQSNKEKKLVRLDSRWYFNRWSILMLHLLTSGWECSLRRLNRKRNREIERIWRRQQKGIVILFRRSLNVPKKFSFEKVASFEIFHRIRRTPLPKNTFHVFPLPPSLSFLLSSDGRLPSLYFHPSTRHSIIVWVTTEFALQIISWSNWYGCKRAKLGIWWYWVSEYFGCGQMQILIFVWNSFKAILVVRLGRTDVIQLHVAKRVIIAVMSSAALERQLRVLLDG